MSPGHQGQREVRHAHGRQGGHVLTGGSNSYTADSERRDRGGQDSILDSRLSYFLYVFFSIFYSVFFTLLFFIE